MSTATEHPERELKFAVPADWDLDEPTPLVPPGGSVQREVLHLESVYFDTDELDLLRAGLTLRRRTGDATSGWQLKVPEGDARVEIRYPLDGPDPSAELRDLVLGVTAGARLRPVATIATQRSVLRVHANDGNGLAEIALDAVTATRAGQHSAASQWREVEVELLGGKAKLLSGAAKWLGKLGAQPAGSGSKLTHALGFAGATGPESGLGALIARYLGAQREAILRGDIQTRRGRDVVHPTRVATRRYRSVLRVFADLFDADRAAALDAELKWYAHALGELRDRQVMRAHLDEQLAALPSELALGPVAARISESLDADLARARADLDELLRSVRYQALLRELTAWHEQLPLRSNPPADAVRAVLRRAKRKVRNRLVAAARLPEGRERDAAMHRARKAAKRARYTAELARPELGGKAAKAVARMKQLQNTLGERQDGVLAAEFLLQLGRTAGTTSGENGFTFGLLFEQERERTRAADRAATVRT